MKKLTAAEKTARLIARNNAAEAARREERAALHAEIVARLDALEAASIERDKRVCTLMGW